MGFDTSSLTTLLRVNGLTPQSAPEQISAVLRVANYTDEEIVAAIKLLQGPVAPTPQPAVAFTPPVATPAAAAYSRPAVPPPTPKEDRFVGPLVRFAWWFGIAVFALAVAAVGMKVRQAFPDLIYSILSRGHIFFAYTPLVIALVLYVSNCRKHYSTEGKRIVPAPVPLFRTQTMAGYVVLLLLFPLVAFSFIGQALSIIGYVFGYIPSFIGGSGESPLGLISLMYGLIAVPLTVPAAVLLAVLFFLFVPVTFVFWLIGRKKNASATVKRGDILALLVLVVFACAALVQTAAYIVKDPPHIPGVTDKPTAVGSATTGPDDLLHMQFISETDRGPVKNYYVLTFTKTDGAYQLQSSPTKWPAEHSFPAPATYLTLSPNQFADPSSYGKPNALVLTRDGKDTTLVRSHAGYTIDRYNYSPDFAYVTYMESPTKESGIVNDYLHENLFVIRTDAPTSPIDIGVSQVSPLATPAFISNHEFITYRPLEKKAGGGYTFEIFVYDLATHARTVIPLPEAKTLTTRVWLPRTASGNLYFLAIAPGDKQALYRLPSFTSTAPAVAHVIDDPEQTTGYTSFYIDQARLLFGDTFYTIERHDDTADPTKKFFRLVAFDLTNPDSPMRVVYTFPKDVSPWIAEVK